MKLIILDRDGVINKDSADYIKSVDEWELLPKSADAIAYLNQSDFTVVVATNQSGIGRGLFTMHDFNQMQRKMYKAVQQAGGEIAGVWFCPHTPLDECDCRKPKTGMLEDIFERFKVDPQETYMVGDSLRDLVAIESFGGKPILVLCGKGKYTLENEEHKLPANTQIFDDLWQFAQVICQDQ